MITHQHGILKWASGISEPLVLVRPSVTDNSKEMHSPNTRNSNHVEISLSGLFSCRFAVGLCRRVVPLCVFSSLCGPAEWSDITDDFVACRNVNGDGNVLFG